MEDTKTRPPGKKLHRSVHCYHSMVIVYTFIYPQKTKTGDV